MGYITNSVGLRLGFSKRRGWNDKIFTNSYGFDMVFFKKFLVELVSRLFVSRRFQKRGFMFSHLSLKASHLNKLLVSVYLYDSEIDVTSIKIHRLITSLYGLKCLKHKFKYRLRKLLPYHERKIINDYILQGRSYRATLARLNDTHPAYLIRFLHSYVSNGREPLYNYLNSYFSSYASKALNIPVQFDFKLLPQRIPSAPLLSNYIVRKLFYKFRLNQILNPIIRRAPKSSLIGLRISTSGRFTRAQRASHGTVQFGQVPLNNFSLNIEHINKTIPLKYGVCSVKVWVCYKTFTPEVYRDFKEAEKEYLEYMADFFPTLKFIDDKKNLLYNELLEKSSLIGKPVSLRYYNNKFYQSLLQPKKENRKDFLLPFFGNSLSSLGNSFGASMFCSLGKYRRNVGLFNYLHSKVFDEVLEDFSPILESRNEIERVETEVLGKPYYRRGFDFNKYSRSFNDKNSRVSSVRDRKG